MKKLQAILTAVLTIVVGLGQVAFAGTYEAGLYTTTLDLNVRSYPGVGENRIDHYLLGEQVEVISVVGDWCKVSLKSYKSAYVYCPILSLFSVPKVELHESTDYQPAPELPSTPVQPAPVTVPVPEPVQDVPVAESVLAEELLNEINSWLYENDGEGQAYINDSYWLAEQKAQVWDPTAKLADFSFQYKQSRNQYCSMIFTAEKKSHTIFKAWCEQVNTLDIDTLVLDLKNVVPAAVDLPKLQFADFIEAMLADSNLLDEINTYFSGKQMQVSVRLYKGEKHTMWEARFFSDDTPGSFYVRTAADDTLARFTTEKV